MRDGDRVLRCVLLLCGKWEPTEAETHISAKSVLVEPGRCRWRGCPSPASRTSSVIRNPSTSDFATRRVYKLVDSRFPHTTSQAFFLDLQRALRSLKPVVLVVKECVASPATVFQSTSTSTRKRTRSRRRCAPWRSSPAIRSCVQQLCGKRGLPEQWTCIPAKSELVRCLASRRCYPRPHRGEVGAQLPGTQHRQHLQWRGI